MFRALKCCSAKKWRSDEPESDDAARALLRTYQEGALAELEDNTLPQRTGFVELEPELTLLQYGTPWLRLRISGGGRQYVVQKHRTPAGRYRGEPGRQLR